MDTAVYHWDGTNFVADTVPTMTNSLFSNDFKFVVADEGIFGYTAATKTYASVQTVTLYKNKKVWNIDNAIVVLSWADKTGNTTYKDYRLLAYSITGTVYKEVAKI